MIAKKDNKVYFFEVKTRIGTDKGQPYEAVNYYKLIGLKRAINYYLLKNKLNDCKLSLEIISVELNSDKSLKKLKIYQGPEMR